MLEFPTRETYSEIMGEPPDNFQFASQFAMLVERMQTIQAEYVSALERFRAGNETALERLHTDNARRDGEYMAALERLRTDYANRDGEIKAALERLRTDIARRNTWILGIMIGFAALILAGIGVGISVIA